MVHQVVIPAAGHVVAKVGVSLFAKKPVGTAAVHAGAAHVTTSSIPTAIKTWITSHGAIIAGVREGAVLGSLSTQLAFVYRLAVKGGYITPEQARTSFTKMKQKSLTSSTPIPATPAFRPPPHSGHLA